MQYGKTLIVEGVHLDPGFNSMMIDKYGEQCVCFVIITDDKEEHIKRSKGRSESMNPERNKFVENYE